MLGILNLVVACGSRDGVIVTSMDASSDSSVVDANRSEGDSDAIATADSEADIPSSIRLDADSDVTDESVDSEDSVDAAHGMDCEYPKEGCPCEWGLSQPCCLRSSEGLDCTRRLVDGELVASWAPFYDCGCLDVPECSELYDLCPSDPSP